MNSTERVTRTLKGLDTDRQPIYGWVFANCTEMINKRWGSVPAFEDKYEFDMAHLFAGPSSYRQDVLAKLRAENEELTPDILVETDFFTNPNRPEDYQNLIDQLAFHKQRGRFCYIQTPGFFEAFNEIFGIENQLMYLALYPDELAELYHRQCEWSKQFAAHCIERGVDCVHISDDWGSQKSLMFSPNTWEELIFPNIKSLVDEIHNRGSFASLHSDGCITQVAHRIPDIGLDFVHPWQESAGMSYDFYLNNFQDKFAILGGICVQTAIGILPREQLGAEIERVFSLLRGKRWMCCTTHFVQDHCSVEDLEYAFDLIYRLARKPN